MKKTLAILLSLVMIVGLFAGCGSAEKPAAEAGGDYKIALTQDGLGVEMAVTCKDTALMNGSLVVDEQGFTVQIPQLNAQPVRVTWQSLGLDTSALSQVEDSMEEYLQMLEQVSQMLPEPQVLKDLVSRYLGLMLSEIEDVAWEDATLTAAGVSQDLSALTLTVDEKAVEKGIVAVLKAIPKDDQLKGLVEDILEN